MSQTHQQLLTEALDMSTAERGRLAAILIESLETETDADAQEAWSVEIAQRLQDIESGRVKTVPWDEARRIIRGENGSTAD